MSCLLAHTSLPSLEMLFDLNLSISLAHTQNLSTLHNHISSSLPSSVSQSHRQYTRLMASDDLTHTSRTSTFRWTTRRKLLRSRRKVPSVRLGGEKKRSRGFFIVKMLKRIRLRWLKLQYSCMLKKLKDYYYSAVKDLIEAGATLESVQRRIMMETSFSVPVMGAPSAGIASAYVNYESRSHRQRQRQVRSIK